MSKFIYQMCTFSMYTSHEPSFSTEYKFDSFFTSRTKAIEETLEYLKFLKEEYPKIEVTPYKFENEHGLYSILALVRDGEKKEYYGFKKHRLNI